MSLTILALAAAHALPPILGAVIGKSRKAVIIGGIIAGFIGLAAGSPAFAMYDLAGAALGIWIGFEMVSRQSQDR